MKITREILDNGMNIIHANFTKKEKQNIRKNAKQPQIIQEHEEHEDMPQLSALTET